jgi:hypothetical protein
MAFLHGMELSERFYREAVRPIVDAHFGGVPHAAGLLGPGSEVLGLDTEMSADHGWGPRVLLFLGEADHASCAGRLRDVLSDELPPEFLGWSTNFSPPDPADNGTQRMVATAGRVSHRVDVWSVRGFILDQLGFDLSSPLDELDWLTFPQQRLLGLTAGGVFSDELGLGELQALFAWYPHDVWLYLLACAWHRIGQEDHLMGRAALLGDDLGSVVIAARLVRDAMRLAFLMERKYAPYPKWLGRAFRRLSMFESLEPGLLHVLRANNMRDREDGMCQAWRVLGAMHNDLGITDPIEPRETQFFGRPIRVIGLRGHAAAIAERIKSPVLRAVWERRKIGGIDQISDSTDVVADPSLRDALKNLYG